MGDIIQSSKDFTSAAHVMYMLQIVATGGLLHLWIVHERQLKRLNTNGLQLVPLCDIVIMFICDVLNVDTDYGRIAMWVHGSLDSATKLFFYLSTIIKEDRKNIHLHDCLVQYVSLRT